MIMIAINEVIVSAVLQDELWSIRLVIAASINVGAMVEGNA
jgi:hypothetical protein